MDDDLELLKRAEQVLSEIDREHGLIDRHADILAALRIRIEGGPRRTLEELIDAAGDIAGKRARELEDRMRAAEGKPKGDLGDLMRGEPKPKGSLDDLLKGQ